MPDVLVLALPFLGLAALTVGVLAWSRRMRSRSPRMRLVPLAVWCAGLLGMLVLLSAVT
ncbi:hypothetical protein [Cellulomonas hominis]|uniref:hypothetical protein n=1 Tax=Cellulomonas hominis TaxID=156981 RepID=UPI001B9A9881|nr:hypothetical protein [Cellulomonas hominis]VTR77156.1 hypothetical protein CHMI_01924 [Cellulomonas hominis]